MSSLGALYSHLQTWQQAGGPQDAAHPVGELPALRAAAAGLCSSAAGSGADAAGAAGAAAQRGLDAPVPPELFGAIELLAAALLAPPEEIFAYLGGAPRAPQGNPAAYWEATALRLQLLCALLPRLGPVELEGGSAGGGGDGQGGRRHAEPAPGRRRGDEYNVRPPPVVGIVEVVEDEEEGGEGEDGGGDGGGGQAAALRRRRQRAALAAVAFEVVALYADDGGGGGSGADDEACAATEKEAEAAAAASNGPGADGERRAASGASPVVTSPALLSVMEDTWRQSRQLPTPWASPEASALAGRLLAALEAAVGAEGGGPGGGTEEGGPGAPARLPAAAAEEWLIPRVRDPLFAPHRHTQAQERGASEAYTGPGTFERALAARKLAWAIRRTPARALCRGPALFAALLPPALAASDDAAAPVARCGHVALASLARAAPPGALGPRRELLLARARRLVVGCEAGAWVSALPAAVELVQALEPPNDPRAEGYHSLLKELLTEAERAAHKRPQVLVFLACLGSLLPRLGLYATRHLGRACPLLLEWSLAPDGGTRRAALGALEGVLRACWPRAGAHGAAVWRHLLAAARSADALAWQTGGGGGGGKAGSEAAATAEAMQSVGRLLAALCGREALAAAESTGGPGAAEAGSGLPGPSGAEEPPGACEAALRLLVA